MLKPPSPALCSDRLFDLRNLTMSTLKQLQKAIDDQLAGDGSALRYMARELYSENDRLKKQIENLLKPMRDKLAEERDALREACHVFLDARKHGGYGMDDAETAIRAALSNPAISHAASGAGRSP